MSSLPEKLYFKIGEVAEMTGVKPHVLRYWESEFSCFRPVKSRKKQRLYQQKDIDLILQLKELLYGQGYTIAGAKSKLKEGIPSEHIDPECEKVPDVRIFLEDLRADILRLRDSIIHKP